MPADGFRFYTFNSLFLTYWNNVFELCFYYTGDYNTSKDLTQNIFLDLWQRKKTFDDQTGFEKYATRCAKYQVYNYFRYQNKTERRPIEEIPEAAVSSYNPEVQYRYKELEAKINGHIASLKEPCRTIFCLSRYDMLSHQSIAQRLGIPARTVEFHISSALKVLRKALSYPAG